MTMSSVHPAQVLLDAQAGGTLRLPVCDHYSGVEERMRKSLQLQAEMMAEFGTCVFDVTLDCEDGAPVGQERQHAELVAGLARGAAEGARVAARVHAVDHPAFQQDMDIIAGSAAAHLCHIMLPKVESVEDVVQAEKALQRATSKQVPLHVLIESPAAVHRAFDIAAHPAVQSISFGLMDFVSAHGGAIPSSAMGVQGQFQHPLVVRAKLEIAAACHAHGKVPSHCVVTEFKNPEVMQAAATKAFKDFGYTRIWSIHPGQIRPILAAFMPASDEVALATDILAAAAKADWAPISHNGVLHDRASYRYFWQLLERAHQTGQHIPVAASHWFATSGS